MCFKQKKIIEFITFTACLAGPIYVCVKYAKLPQMIPTHFGLFGQADHWSPKEFIWLISFLSIFSYCLLNAAQYMPNNPNITWKGKTHNREANLKLVAELLFTIKILLVILFLYLQWAIIATALNKINGIGAYFLPILLIGIFIPIIRLLLLSFKLNNRTE